MQRSTRDGVARSLGIAERQHGVVITRQFRGSGLSKGAVARLCSEGWLRPVRPGAYAIAGRPPSPWEAAVAAGLLAGAGAVLSHATAAAIHRLPGLVAGESVELTVIRPRHPTLSDVVVHRVQRLEPCDIEERSGLLVTTAARTLVDLAPRLPEHLLAKVIDEGCIDRLWTVDQIQRAAKRAGVRGRRQGRQLRVALGLRLDESEADSRLEIRVVNLLRPWAPFEVHYQLVLEGQVFILDLAWPQWKVAVETDGWFVRSHSRSKFDQDRRKANALAAADWTVAHVTSSMDDDEVVASVGRLLPWRETGSVPPIRPHVT